MPAFFLLVLFPGKVFAQSCNNWLSTPSAGSFVTIGDLDIAGNKLTVEAVFNRASAPGNGLNSKKLVCQSRSLAWLFGELEFSVYNRWGERIFFTKNAGQCWDGTYKGTKQNCVYVYMIRAKTNCESEVFRKGTFVLVR